jgi:hypothetical protein
VQRAQRLRQQVLACMRSAPGVATAGAQLGQALAPGGAQVQLAPAGVDAVVARRLEQRGPFQRLRKGGGMVDGTGLFGQDQRRARFVDEDAVGLVDDGQVQPAQLLGRAYQLRA